MQAQINQQKAFQFTSTAENSTVNWWDQYGYIQDILDGRGYTAGLVGFCSATGDMLELVQQYVAEKPGNNILAPYLKGLHAYADAGDTVADAEYGVDGGGVSDMAERISAPGSGRHGRGQARSTRSSGRCSATSANACTGCPPTTPLFQMVSMFWA